MNGSYCSLIIKGNNLNFDEIQEKLGIKASKKFIQGEVISKVIGKNKFDLIRFDEKIDELNLINYALDNILNLVLLHKSYVKSLQKKYDVILKCFVQSDNAQINYIISKDIISKIADVGIDLKISILSWGKI